MTLNIFNLHQIPEIQTIANQAFSYSYIESFLITPKVKELQQGFITKSPKLKKIEVMPGNPYFKVYENKFLLKKSTENSQEFDFLVLAVKDLKTVNLPNDIKIIGAYSFDKCQQLSKIEVSCDSKLQRIEKFAFYDSEIEWFTIPKSFVNFEKGWNSNTFNLKKISVMEGNPNFKVYDNNFVLGKTNKEKDEFDSLVFVTRDIKIEKVTLPKFIKKIDFFAFDRCQYIKEIVIPENSELQIIEQYAFSNSSIEKVSISPSVAEILDCAFTRCQNLREVEIPENSKLEKLGNYAFEGSAIEKFTIPPHLTEISERTFFQCTQLQTVEFHPNSELRIICKEAFKSSSIEKFTIPPHLTEICEYAFEYCSKLQTVETAPNSELRTIGKGAFSASSIKKFTIPLHLTEIREKAFWECMKLEEVFIPPNSELRSIGKSAFSQCLHLSEVKFSEDSKLETIEEGAFEETKIESFTIPPHITKIEGSLFKDCYHLQEVKTTENSELRSIGDEPFKNSIITSITIPSGFVEFDRKWCIETALLLNVNISPENRHFRSYESGLVLGKSNHNSAEFDVLVFCPRNVEKVTIPNFIKIINPYCFDLCYRILDLDFQSDSKIEIIDDFAFHSCLIQKVLIPKNIKKIGEAAFCECENLKKVMFEENSDTQLIENSAFKYTQIESFVVPPHIQILDCNIFSESCIKIIEVVENSELNQIIIDHIHNESLIIMIPKGQNVNFLFE